MKKTLFTLILFTVFTLLITGCKKDDDNKISASIEGKWKGQSYIEKYREGEGQWHTESGVLEAGEYDIEFKDGKFIEYYDNEADDIGDYYISGNTLTLDYGSGDKDILTISTLEANKLVLTWEDRDLEGDIWVTEITEITFTK